MGELCVEGAVTQKPPLSSYGELVETREDCIMDAPDRLLYLHSSQEAPKLS